MILTTSPTKRTTSFRNVPDSALTGSRPGRKYALTCVLPVELPGIEPATEIALTCVVAGIWVRETTRNNAKGPAVTRTVLMASTCRRPMQPVAGLLKVAKCRS